MHGAKLAATQFGWANEVCSLLKTGDMWALQVGGIAVGTCAEDWPKFLVVEQFAVSTCEEWPSFVVEMVTTPTPKAQPQAQPKQPKSQPAKRPTAAKSAPNKMARQSSEQAAPLGQPSDGGKVLCK